MQDKSIFQEMVTHLKVCVERFESEIKEDLSRSFPYEITLQQQIFIENSKHYHYTEILKHINIIKLQLESIMYHDQKLMYLHGCPDQEEYYKSINSKTRLEEIQYVRKQVENFSLSPQYEVHQREKRPVRKHNESSMKYLTLWEQFLEKQKADNAELDLNVPKGKVVRRNLENGKRKHLKLVSSTYDAILDVESPTELKKMDEIRETSEEPSQERLQAPNIEENEDFIRKRSNMKTKDENTRISNEYFSDIFENCDDLIEIINRKSMECRKSTSKPKRTTSQSAVDKLVDKNSQDQPSEEDDRRLCEISELCHNISFCLNKSKCEDQLSHDEGYSSSQLKKTEVKFNASCSKQDSGISDTDNESEITREKQITRPKIVGVVYKKEASTSQE